MIYLKNNLKITKQYSGKSKFDFFQKLSVDDIIEIKTPMFMYGCGYSNDIYMTIISGKFVGEIFKCSNGNFNNYIARIGYEEYSQ